MRVSDGGHLSPVSRMLCGLGAGVAEATLVVTWIETLKVITIPHTVLAIINLTLPFSVPREAV